MIPFCYYNYYDIYEDIHLMLRDLLLRLGDDLKIGVQNNSINGRFTNSVKPKLKIRLRNKDPTD